jgi:hypothetical protein
VAIPTVDQILQQLMQLNGAVAMGIMSIKQAGLISRTLKSVLDVQLKRANREESGANQEALVDLCRRDPRALELIEPFLTDAQVEGLMAEIQDDDDADEST